MNDKVKYWFTGQSGFELDCGGHEKTRVVFAMIAEDKSEIAWYMFSSTPSRKGQAECAKTDVWIIDDPFGFRVGIGRTIPHTFQKKIAIDGLADGSAGSVATLTIDTEDKSRFVSFRISDLKTKAGEIVTFPFGMQKNDTPKHVGETIKGRVYFLEKRVFVEKDFDRGPQEKSSESKVSGAVL